MTFCAGAKKTEGVGRNAIHRKRTTIWGVLSALTAEHESTQIDFGPRYPDHTSGHRLEAALLGTMPGHGDAGLHRRREWS